MVSGSWIVIYDSWEEVEDIHAWMSRVPPHEKCSPGGACYIWVCLVVAWTRHTKLATCISVGGTFSDSSIIG